MYIYIYIYTHTTYVHRYVHIYLYKYIHIRIYINIYIYINLYIDGKFLNTKIDYILVELTEYSVALCCIYCPPLSKVQDIITVLEYLKLCCNTLNLVVHYNFNLLNDSTDMAIDFLNNLNVLSLHPTTVLIKVTNTSAALIDNFMCDFDFFQTKSSIFKIDISDHYLITLNLDFDIPMPNS